MKLLFLAPYVYAPAYKEHSKNKTGFGFMVHDIASGVGKLGNRVVLATYAFGPKRNCQDFVIAGNKPWQNILFGHYKGIIRFCLELKKNGASFKDVLRGAYYHLHIGYIRHLVKKEKPDVVHIHGCTTELAVTLRMLKALGVPSVVTLHGLLQDDPGASQYQKNCERQLVKDGNTTLTVISSKMKERLLSDYYGADNTDNVHVITNGVNMSRQDASYDIRAKHGIPADKKIILTIGSVCALKNQSQIARAFAMLPKELREQYVLLFAGTIHENAPVLQEIETLGLTEQALCLGFVPREELCNYYSVADLTVTASVTEGFGIPMIEGFVYGVPCVAFADLDAIGDIHSDCAMLLCQTRSDEALADTMCQALGKAWNKKEIMEHSKKFSLEQMARSYQNVYENTLES